MFAYPAAARTKVSFSSCGGPRRSSGFSLVELMIGLVIAGILLLGMAAYFVTSSRNFSETERASRQIENGRYAAQVLSEDIRHAGFYGEVNNVVFLPVGSGIAMPVSLPDPCVSDITSVRLAVPLAIQGVDAPGTAPTCLPDYVAGTDVLVIRRSSTIPIAVASAVANGYYTQVGFCQTAPTMFTVDQSGFTLTAKDCGTVQPIREYHVYIYYIAKCSIGTGAKGACATTDPQVPTLKRLELRAGSDACSPWCAVPLVEGIENLQIEYGLDTKVKPDGSPTAFTSSPANMTQWAQVVAVRLHVLARNTDITAGFSDTKTYSLGNKADGTAYTFSPASPASTDPFATDPNLAKYRRHAYTEVVRVQNVSQRIEAVFP